MSDFFPQSFLSLDTYSAATQGSSSPTSTVSKSEGRRYLDLINGVSDGGVPNEQVQPFSDQWIEAHGLDREEVRQVEAEINNIFTSKVNLIDKPSKKPTKDDWESPFFEKK